MAQQVTITAMDSFTGKLAVVTGGGSGIGRALGLPEWEQMSDAQLLELIPDAGAGCAHRNGPAGRRLLRR
jgi:hypothetical protein